MRLRSACTFAILFIFVACHQKENKAEQKNSLKKFSVLGEGKEDVLQNKVVADQNPEIGYDTLVFEDKMSGPLLDEKFNSARSELNYYRKYINKYRINKLRVFKTAHSKTAIKYLGTLTDLKTKSTYHIITNFTIVGIGEMLAPRGNSKVAFIDDAHRRMMIYRLSMPEELPILIKDNVLFFTYKETKLGISISGGLPPELCLPYIGCY